MNIQRYWVGIDNVSGIEWEDSNGEWVKYADHEAALAEKDAETSRLRNELLNTERKDDRLHSNHSPDMLAGLPGWTGLSEWAGSALELYAGAMGKKSSPKPIRLYKKIQ